MSDKSLLQEAGGVQRAQRVDLVDELCSRFLREAPFQPATDFWRAIEIATVVDHGLPAGTGLDLACGDGVLMRILLDYVGPRDLIGVDIDPAETRLAETLGIYRKVLTAPGSAIPLPDGQLDWVFSNSSLEHFEQVDEALAEVARLLRPGGIFLFTVPANGFHQSLRGPLLPGASRSQYLRRLDARVAHLRYWSVAEWTAHLRAQGLEVTSAQPYMSAAEVRRWETIARWTSGVLYTVMGGRRQPIEIQRRFGIRHRRIGMPGWMARWLGRLLRGGLSAGSAPGEPNCLLVEARKMPGGR